MIHCPLPTVNEEDLHQGVKCLLQKCRAVQCSYVDSAPDTDYLPGSCILLAIALLDPDCKEEME